MGVPKVLVAEVGEGELEEGGKVRQQLVVGSYQDRLGVTNVLGGLRGSSAHACQHRERQTL